MRTRAKARDYMLRARAKITWQNARSGSDQCSIPNAQFSAEVDVGLRVVRSVRIRIEHWESNIGQILGLMSSSEYCQVIFARFLDETCDSHLALADSRRGFCKMSCKIRSNSAGENGFCS